MLKEACVENFTSIPYVINKGADRIELNNNLTLGGTTPSYGVIKKQLLMPLIFTYQLL
ncbi:copper homeostasis protein CutC [Lactobacillus sp. R2/2]|nr:copper homeostasis protein CutC [Lactobacillus sp. R2/2]